MAQPSASQSLAELESLLQTPLFLRHSRGMSLTAAGRALLPLARRLLDEWQHLPHRHWACPGCREIVDGPFEVCWNCGTAMPAPPGTP